jgi:hypothetical protein
VEANYVAMGAPQALQKMTDADFVQLKAWAEAQAIAVPPPPTADHDSRGGWRAAKARPLGSP